MKTVFLILFSFLFIHTALSVDVEVMTSGTSFTTYGKYLTNSDGLGLYIYKPDYLKTDSQCTGGCKSIWLPLEIASSPAKGDSNVDTSMLGTITRSDDSKLQVTYNGWLLYTFHNDANSGDTKGQGFGSLWFLMNPDGNPIFTTSSDEALESEASYTLKMNTFDKVTYVEDNAGHTLYTFAADTFLTSTCADACASAWPPFTIDSGYFPTAGSGIDATLIYTTTRPDNTIQVTYNGWPLYYYAGEPTGEITCQDLNQNGGYWYIIQPNGKLYKSPLSSTSSTNSQKMQLGIFLILFLLSLMFMI